MADHALRGRNRTRELVADGMAGLVPRDGRVLRRALAGMAVFRVRPRVPRVAVVGVHGVARAAAGRAVVAGLLVGAEEPQVRIVQARLGDVDERHRYAAARRRAAVRLADVGPAGLVELLQRSARVRQAYFGKLRGDD